MIIDDIQRAFAASGLITRGAFHATTADDVPEGGRTVVMIGNAGPDMWRAFAKTERSSANPLDSWTREVLDPIAVGFGATALYPFNGPPYHPFQRWAMRADDVTPSPIGPLIHPMFGLWHAYRGALVFDAELDIQTPSRSPSPCASCTDKPCLNTCPVGAFSEHGYDVPTCRTHIAAPDGQDCLEGGCLARRACPIGQDYIYASVQAGFHMRHFLAGL
jgi:ferredoxin-like protein FixX